MAALALRCCVQQYAWGSLGSASTVARLWQAGAVATGGSDEGVEVVVAEEEPYAELWMGTHPNGPSMVVSGHPAQQGDVPLREVLGEDLPFLFKVLAIRKALSIQAHPNKALAERLHAERPEIYKDPNHKPEMAVALTPFEAMCGFRPIAEIHQHAMEYPEFAALLPADAVAAAAAAAAAAATADGQTGDVVRNLFEGFMRAPDDAVEAQLANLLARLQADGHEASELEGLMLRLAEQFPGDRGAMVPLMLNHLKLGVGESFFMGPDEPHAYVSGDILECMACSDNVVRAGLTPKFRDVDTLCEMLTYQCGEPPIVTPQTVDDVTQVYSPPPSISEFQVDTVTLSPEDETPHELYTTESPALLLALDGQVQLEVRTEAGDATTEPETVTVSCGQVYCLGAGAHVTVRRQGTTAAQFARAHTRQELA